MALKVHATVRPQLVLINVFTASSLNPFARTLCLGTLTKNVMNHMNTKRM